MNLCVFVSWWQKKYATKAPTCPPVGRGTKVHQEFGRRLSKYSI